MLITERGGSRVFCHATEKDCFILKDELFLGKHHITPGKLLLGDTQMTKLGS